jgi:hypothetical protein
MGKVIFEVAGGSPEQNRKLEDMFRVEVAKRLQPKKLWECRCECGEILGSGYKRRISLARVVPHCEGMGMRWEPQNPATDDPNEGGTDG